jgi:hypothetical protein
MIQGRNDATELAHADMTALPKTDTNYTALSLILTITGNTFAASLRTDICPQRKESSSTSHARNPFNLNFFDSAQCLMVRRWRLIGYFPILYNPPIQGYPSHAQNNTVRSGRITREALQQQSQTHRRKPQGRNKTQCVKTSLLTLQNQNPHTRTNTYARTLTNQHGSHRQCRRNDATSLLMLI